MDTKIDTSGLVEGDKVYAYRDVIYIGGEVVGVSDLPDMSQQELHELHESLMELITTERRNGHHLYRMLTAVLGEFARRA